MTDTDELAGRLEAFEKMVESSVYANWLVLTVIVQRSVLAQHLRDTAEAASALRALRAERDEARGLLAVWSKQNKHAQDAAEATHAAEKAKAVADAYEDAARVAGSQIVPNDYSGRAERIAGYQRGRADASAAIRARGAMKGEGL